MRRLLIGSAPSVVLRKKRNGKSHTQKEPNTEGRKVLRSKTRSGRLVRLGVASIKEPPSASLENDSKPTGPADAEPNPKGRKVLRSKTRSGRFVTVGTASLKEQPFASWEKVQETLAKANAASRETIRKHRAELLGKD